MKEKRLSDLRPGERGRVTRIDGQGAAQRRMLGMGIVRGEEVEIVRNAPLGDPLELQLKGYSLTLRREEAKKVWLELEE